MVAEDDRNFDFVNLINSIDQLPQDWHLAGVANRQQLCAILKYARRFESVENSIETGSGKTTLLFSHLSRHHLVFAIDGGDKSISSVKESPLFNPTRVTFVEGPTQKTLSRHSFDQKFSMALIDGPHGYPFPDMEYYYIYPHLITGGILFVDDIQIPSIRKMFEFIKTDEMFRLLEVVRNMAFFERTESPAFDPYSDGWWLQRYNLPSIRNKKVGAKLASLVPVGIRRCIPEQIRNWWLSSF